MGMIDSLHQCLILVDGISSFVIVEMPILDDIYLVFVHEVLQ